MKKIFFMIILLLLTTMVNSFAIDNLECNSSILVDAESGKVLYSKYPDRIKYPASLTKLMTAVIAVENGDLDDVYTVDDETPFTIDGSHIALEPGEKLTLEELLHALLIPSANDAAEVIAINNAGSVESFVEKMNEKAAELGMTNTNFVNPHGLHDDSHYTTASDLAKLAVYAYKNEVIRNIVKKKNYTIPATNIKEDERLLNTTNRLFIGTGYGNQIIIDGKYRDIKYDGATGMKTGYTPQAGSTFIGSAERDGLTLISVVLDGYITEVYSDTVKLLDYGFSNFEKIGLVETNTYVDSTEVIGANVEKIPLVTEDSFSSVIEKNESSNITSRITMDEITLPIKKDQCMGKYEFLLNDEVIGAVNLYTPIRIDEFAPINTRAIVVKTILSVFLAIAGLILLLRLYFTIRVWSVRKNKKLKL
ncbi:D-alanyl-D-alanine carboxypeptidase (penicillin-binding protein 5/6) [Dethiosulfatibacter aminovorans DSM 17477]|uniref:serine-type D-Ala-D-Ala carboxypeptidase n=1 Tax=Dethiosulfatibacter aminovorans DSM 17477 TaxID=1121476 RepID=A0A1M6CYM4_9FIRM|nr:D-alanyl-D-alanine carboxypeptidase family protein [Dethiosulfatibacter aminovorans]SHI66070.1 D-alanyl-D-alanine carboxypeptidase (penicillin-binding protein 5/6) [Dethiosulfatibacter aminovorans DSM 17477]